MAEKDPNEMIFSTLLVYMGSLHWAAVSTLLQTLCNFCLQNGTKCPRQSNALFELRKKIIFCNYVGECSSSGNVLVWYMIFHVLTRKVISIISQEKEK